MSQFAELLAAIQAEQEEQTTLAKALPAEDGEDDQAIQAAAADGADGDVTDLDGEEGDDDDADGDDSPLTKSIVIDGEEVQVVDADVMIKSLQDLTARVTDGEAVLAKALSSTLETVKAQGVMIKSLSAQVKKLGGSGTGRKTVLTIHDKPAVDETLAKGGDAELTAGDVMAKANAAFQSGKINGLELTTIDVALRNNQQIDRGLLTKALS